MGPQSNLFGFKLGLLATDTSLLALVTTVVIQFRAQVDLFGDSSDVLQLLYPIAGLVIGLWLLGLFLFGGYREDSIGAGAAEYKAVLRGSFATAGLIGISAYLFHYPLSRAFFFVLFILGIPVLLLGRYLLRCLLHCARRNGKFRSSILLAGDQLHTGQLIELFEREQWLGYDVVGILSYESFSSQGAASPPVLGTPGDVLAAVKATNAEAVILTEGALRKPHHFNLLARQMEQEHTKLLVVPAVNEVAATRMTARPIAGVPMLIIEKPYALKAGRYSKRIFDLVASSLILLVLSPVLAITALAIKLGDGGPVIFRQRRVGLGGQSYDCLKFRSMVTDAEALKPALAADQTDGSGPLFKLRHDPRITPVGRFIRRYSIDELPQLFNVLQGEMSLVGPRPALESEVAQYRSYVLRRLDVRPGITGLWQVSGRSDLPWDDAVRLDLYYVDNWSFCQDLMILIKTVRAVFSASGAY